MADKERVEMSENEHILYNLLVYAEWNLEGEVLNKDSLDILQKRGSLGTKFLSLIEGSLGNFLRLLKYPFRNISNIHGLPEEITKLYDRTQVWDFLLSCDGQLLAVLQDHFIEIRSCKDNFSSVISKCQICKDPSPKWRMMSWDNDSTMLAFAYSFGVVVIFDRSGSMLCSLKDNQGSTIYTGASFYPSKAIAAMIFVEHKEKGGNGEFEKQTTFSFHSVLPCGISSCLYYPSSNLLIIGSPGLYQTDSKAAISLQSQLSAHVTYLLLMLMSSETSAIANGITLWRILSDLPYFKLVEDQALELKKSQQQAGLLAKLLPSRSNDEKNGVWKISLNHDGSQLLVLHYSGKLSLWEVPSLRMKESWSLQDQPEYKNEGSHLDFPTLNSRNEKSNKDNFLYDIAWWSNDAVVLTRTSGAVTVSTVKNNLHNILGQYPEWCEPLPLVTSAFNGGFLILECENTIVSSSSGHSSSKIIEETNHDKHKEMKEDAEDEDEEDSYVIKKTKEITKHLLYILTESERFRPPIRKPKILKQTYRLLSLRSTTPEELYARKIELEEYGEALALAQSYGLDCDLVYQRQWRKAKVNVSSIHDYLSKVTKRIWVLHECLERIPDDLDSTKALLRYGLHGTGLHVLTLLGKEGSEHPFIKDGHSDDEEEEMKERENEKKLLRNIDFKNLSVEQRNICRYRLRFLKYLDRLATYELILGGAASAYDHFDSTFFNTFRDSNLVETTVDFARDNNWQAVDVILTYHGETTLKHYLPILSNFPETTSPYDYRDVLPEAGINADEPDVYQWQQKSWRAQDWLETHLEIFEEEQNIDDGESLYKDNAALERFCNITNSQGLTDWYKFRANEIERYSCQIDNALELIKLGKERGVKGLVSLHDDLITLSHIVYECRCDDRISLESFQKLTNLEKMKLLLKKSNEQSFVDDFKKWVQPFLQRVEKRTTGKKMKLMKHYMIETAKNDLTFPLKILEQSVNDVVLPFIPDVSEQMELTIDCIYLCTRDDQLDEAIAMVKCFTMDENSISSQKIIELRKKLQEIEIYIQGAQILLQNELPKPISFLSDNKGNEEIACSMMESLAQLARRRQPIMNNQQWTTFLGDLLKLRDLVFSCISRTVCYRVCSGSLLASGNKQNINHCKQLLCCRSEDTSPGDKVAYEEAVEMVVAAAREYFNSSNDLNEPSMTLAKACLELMPGDEVMIKEELDLITSLSMLVEYNVVMLPLQVRLCQDKAELIEKCLESCPWSYKDPGKLLHLASLLQLSGGDEKMRRGRVLTMIAEHSLHQHADYIMAYHACTELIKASYIAGWKICRTLGEDSNFTNLAARRKLLDFSLSHCDPNFLEMLLQSRSLLQTEILYNNVGSLMSKIEDFVDPEDTSTTQQLSKTTKTIISNVSDIDWWRSSLQWVRPLNKVTTTTDENETTPGITEEETVDFHCHPFYQSLYDEPETNIKAVIQDEDDDALRVSELLLQIQKMAEERADGSIEEPGTDVLLQLANDCFRKDTTMSLAYLLALPEFNLAYECFERLPSCALTLEIATYYYALQVYNELNPCDQELRSDVYDHSPDDVIDHVIRGIDDAGVMSDNVKFLLVHLKRYHNQLSDFSQAKLLQKLGRGVDIGRFTQDEDYKRETILGLTMSVDDTIFTTAILLAERYEIDQWEMFMSHLEWLFTDSELPTKQLQERVKDKEIMEKLLERPGDVIRRLQEYIYPSIDGKQLARLLYYYMLCNECVTKGNITLDDEYEPQIHMRLIRKIKAAAQGIDYKSLMYGNDPLECLRSHLIPTNVHVFAKMANKFHTKDGTVVTASQIFKTFALKIFWEGERKMSGKEVDWIHRYEVVHGYLDRLNNQDMIELIDTLTFSDKAMETLTLELRDDIIRRALKYSRQMSGKQRKKSKDDLLQSIIPVDKMCEYFEQSLAHLASLGHALIMKLEASKEARHCDYVRLYDQSRCEPEKIRDLCVGILCCGDELVMVGEFLSLANRQCAHGLKMKDLLKEAFRTLLRMYSHSDEEQRHWFISENTTPLDLIKSLLINTRQYMADKSHVMTNEDILEEFRTFCGDEQVPPGIKPGVLQLLEQYIILSNEDKIMLLYHQTNAVICDHWDIKININDVSCEEKRSELFDKLFDENINHEQILSLASLLEIWPTFTESNGENSPWYRVLFKIAHTFKDSVSLVKLINNDSISLQNKECQSLLEVLLANEDYLSCFKVGLIAGDAKTFDFIVSLMKQHEPGQTTCDDELLELIHKHSLSSRIVDTAFFQPYVSYLLRNTTAARTSRVEQVIHDLHNEGYTLEATSLRTSLDNLHPILRTMDTALGSFFKWITKEKR